AGRRPRHRDRRLAIVVAMAAAPDRPPRRLARVAVGVVVSAVAMWLAVRGVSWDAVGEALAGVAWGWLPVIAALKVVAVWIKAVRWRVELAAMDASPPPPAIFRAVALGYFGNVMLPLRLGELMRVGLLRRIDPRLDLGGALATIAAERVL